MNSLHDVDVHHALASVRAIRDLLDRYDAALRHPRVPRHSSGEPEWRRALTAAHRMLANGFNPSLASIDISKEIP